jgi:sugar phosphate isomerase/epimerase
MNRRHFIGSGIAASAALGGPAAAAAAAGAPGFQLGAVTYNTLKDFELPAIISLLENVGFEGVELRTTHRHGVEPSISADERTRVRRMFEASRIKLVSYGTTCEFHSPDAAERKRQVEIGKQFVDLAQDTGAPGIKVRPNGFPKELPREKTIENIGNSLRELGDYAATKRIGVWMEVHGRGTNEPAVCASIMKVARHPQVGICWNSNDEEVVNGSVKQPFELLRPWIKHVHINELAKTTYPWRELFTLLRQADYRGYTLAEVAESKEPERFLRWYKALWTELNKSCG